VAAAAKAVDEFVVRRVVPATIEIIDGMCLDAVERLLDDRTLHLHGIPAMLLVDVDGSATQVEHDLARAREACEAANATWCKVATDADEREHLWAVRRQLSPALKMIAPYKVNNDVVVPKGRIPELFALVTELRERYGLPIPCFGHAGDGNIHVNVMVPDPGDLRQMERADAAQADLFDGVIALGGVISGEHGIGVTKSAYIGRNLSPDAIALMKRVKHAFDPLGLLNPGKIFPD
jgi:FAD/FMN-containing dehydrogenase